MHYATVINKKQIFVIDIKLKIFQLYEILCHMAGYN